MNYTGCDGKINKEVFRQLFHIVDRISVVVFVQHALYLEANEERRDGSAEANQIFMRPNEFSEEFSLNSGLSYVFRRFECVTSIRVFVNYKIVVAAVRNSKYRSKRASRHFMYRNGVNAHIFIWILRVSLYIYIYMHEKVFFLKTFFYRVTTLVR